MISYFVIPGLKPSLMPQDATPLSAKDKAESIIGTICRHLNISKSDLMVKHKRLEVSTARHIVWYFMRQEIARKDMSLRQMGEFFGYDHSSVSHGIVAAEKSDELKRIKKIYY